MTVARVLDEDPELGERLLEEDAGPARAAAVARIEELDSGRWTEPDDPDGYRDGYGLLVLDGILARQVTLERFYCTELLGQGDLLRPWTFDGSMASTITSRVTWNVVEPVRIAVLDRRFAVATAAWPELTASLMDRIVQRARWLAFQLAVCHLVRVDLKLLLMFWHYADRWGRMTKEGAMLDVPLTHAMLASVIGARRPSVTTALRRLRDEGLVDRRDGGWILRGQPPQEFARLRAETDTQPESRS